MASIRTRHSQSCTPEATRLVIDQELVQGALLGCLLLTPNKLPHYPELSYLVHAGGVGVANSLYCSHKLLGDVGTVIPADVHTGARDEERGDVASIYNPGPPAICAMHVLVHAGNSTACIPAMTRAHTHTHIHIHR